MRDFLVIGAGSAGCVLAAELARRGAGSVMVLEAGPSEVHPLVSVPFGLVWLMGSKRDWAFQTTPQDGAGNRQIKVPRGRMVGGSGSINSMVWFRGRADDFDGWKIPGWTFQDVEPAFEAVEAALRPTPMTEAHALSLGLDALFGTAPVSPEYESAGIFSHNMARHRRRSAANAFLRPRHDVEIRTGAEVDQLIWRGDRVRGALLVDGTEVYAAKGVILSAGSIGSPSILMRSGIGPADHLTSHDISTRIDAPEIGENLHDHPGVGLHFEGPKSGYGLEPRQWANWAVSPLTYLLRRSGPLASPTVEAGMFFNARGERGTPDVQTHFIPFFLAHSGSRYQMKSGYFADICLCRPKSRGRLRLASSDPQAPPEIDLGLLREPSDVETMAAGVERLRELLSNADFGHRRAAEIYPGPAVSGDGLKNHIRKNCGTAYHPVGTVRLGGPISNRLKVKGARNLWVADASVMPSVTSANTNAPSMMIGWKGAQYIAEDVA